MLITLADDAAELRRLASVTERDAVRTLLLNEAKRLESIALAASTAVQPTQAPLQVQTPQPVAVAVPSTSSSGSPGAVSYTEPKYGFSAEGDFVEVLILDLAGVGSLPKEAVTCDFKPTSFDLKIHGLDGKNYRVWVPSLEKEIKPAESRVVVGKSRVTLQLKKAQSWDYWTQLASKKQPKPADKAKAQPEDPMGGLMDMMKEMYDNGDDQTKKMIAEAWTKSREAQMKGGAGAGLGGGGGLDDF